MRVFPFTFVAATALLAATPAQTAADPNRELVRKAVSAYFANYEQMGDFALTRRNERREYDDKGNLKTRSAVTLKTDWIEGVRWTWVVATNDKPLDGVASDTHRSRLLADVGSWKEKPAAERKRIIEESRRKQREEMDHLKEFPDALEFKAAGMEKHNGRDTLVFDFTPRPNYKSPNMKAKVFEKVRGKIWIDKADEQMVRLQAEVFDNVAFGGFLAKLEKGTRFDMEQMRIEGNRWVPKQHLVRFDVRILLLKSIHRQMESHYMDYRRYTGPVWSGGAKPVAE